MHSKLGPKALHKQSSGSSSCSINEADDVLSGWSVVTSISTESAASSLASVVEMSFSFSCSSFCSSLSCFGFFCDRLFGFAPASLSCSSFSCSSGCCSVGFFLEADFGLLLGDDDSSSSCSGSSFFCSCSSSFLAGFFLDADFGFALG